MHEITSLIFLWEAVLVWGELYQLQSERPFPAWHIDYTVSPRPRCRGNEWSRWRGDGAGGPRGAQVLSRNNKAAETGRSSTRSWNSEAFNAQKIQFVYSYDHSLSFNTWDVKVRNF